MPDISDKQIPSSFIYGLPALSFICIFITTKK